MKKAYLVQLQSGQYGILIDDTIHLLSLEYTIYDLQVHFGTALTIY